MENMTVSIDKASFKQESPHGIHTGRMCEPIMTTAGGVDGRVIMWKDDGQRLSIA